MLLEQRVSDQYPGEAKEMSMQYLVEIGLDGLMEYPTSFCKSVL
jgi:hypothetical protein